MTYWTDADEWGNTNSKKHNRREKNAPTCSFQSRKNLSFENWNLQTHLHSIFSLFTYPKSKWSILNKWLMLPYLIVPGECNEAYRYRMKRHNVLSKVWTLNSTLWCASNCKTSDKIDTFCQILNQFWLKSYVMNSNT